MLMNQIHDLSPNSVVYFRSIRSRKPYKVRFKKIIKQVSASQARLHDKTLYPNFQDNEIVEYLVEVEFSTRNIERTSSADLYMTWDEAEALAPIKNKTKEVHRCVTVDDGRFIILDDGTKVPGLAISLGSFEAIITSYEADTLVRKLLEILGYTSLLNMMKCPMCGFAKNTKLKACSKCDHIYT